jgi:hypothetical protein
MPRQDNIRIQIEGIDKFSQTLEKLEKSLSNFAKQLGVINKSFTKLVNNQINLQKKLTNIYKKSSSERVKTIKREVRQVEQEIKRKINVLNKINSIVSKYYGGDWTANKRLLNIRNAYVGEIKRLMESPEFEKLDSARKMLIKLDFEKASFYEYKRIIDKIRNQKVVIDTKLNTKSTKEKLSELRNIINRLSAHTSLGNLEKSLSYYKQYVVALKSAKESGFIDEESLKTSLITAAAKIKKLKNQLGVSEFKLKINLEKNKFLKDVALVKSKISLLKNSLTISLKEGNLSRALDKYRELVSTLNLAKDKGIIDDSKLKAELSKAAFSIRNFKTKIENEKIKLETKLDKQKLKQEERKLLNELRSLQLKINSMLNKGIYSPLSSKELKHLNVLFNRYKELGESLSKTGAIDSKVFSARLDIMRNKLERVNKTFEASKNKLITWWKRFGEVAVGFTLFYRVMQIAEYGIMRFTDYLKQVIVNFDEMINVSQRMALMYQFFGNGALTYEQALKRSINITNAFRLAMINSTASMQDVIQGLDELAQHGVFISDTSKLKAYINLFNMISMIATTTGSSAIQVRQEIQSLFEGTKRAGNTLIRFVSNLAAAGKLPKDIVKQLQNAANATEQLEIIINKVNPVIEKMNENLFKLSASAAFSRMQKIFYLLGDLGLRLASLNKIGTASRNLFADVFNKITSKYINLDKLKKFEQIQHEIYLTELKLKQAKESGNKDEVDKLNAQLESQKALADSFYNKMYTDKGKELAANLSVIYESLYNILLAMSDTVVSLISKLSQIVAFVRVVYSSFKPIINIVVKLLGLFISIYLINKAIRGLWIVSADSIRLLLIPVKNMFSMFKLIKNGLAKVLIFISKIGTEVELTAEGAEFLSTAILGWVGAITLVVAALYEIGKTIWQLPEDALKAGKYLAWKFVEGINEGFAFLSKESINFTPLGNLFRIFKLITGVDIDFTKPVRKFFTNFYKQNADVAERESKKYEKSWNIFINRLKQNVMNDIDGLITLAEKLLEKVPIIGDFIKKLKGLKKELTSVTKGLTPSPQGLPTGSGNITKTFDQIIQSLTDFYDKYKNIYTEMSDLGIDKLFGLTKEGVLNKIKSYYTKARNEILKQIKQTKDKVKKEKLIIQLANLDLDYKSFMSKLDDALQKIKDKISKISSILSTEKGLFNNLFNLNISNFAGINLSQLKEQINNYYDQLISYYQQEIDKTKDVLEKKKLELQIVATKFEQKQFNAKTSGFATFFKNLINNIKNQFNKIKESTKDTNLLQSLQQLEELRDKLQKAIIQAKSGKNVDFTIFNVKDLQEAQQLLQQVNKEIDNTKEKTKGAKAFFDEFQKYFSDSFIKVQETQAFTQAATDMISSYITNTANLISGLLKGEANAFHNFVSGLLNDMISLVSKLIAKLMIINTLKWAGQTFGIDFSSVLKVLGAANGGVFKGGIQFFANGGVVTQPTIGIVGEGKYNEAVVPLPDGRSIPVVLKNGQTQPNVYINIENKSGVPIDASKTNVTFNGKDFIIHTVLEAVVTRPDVRNTLKSQLR